jgi:secondary thiamine-phosphate synthase enzyme
MKTALVPGMACSAMMQQRLLRISTKGQGLFDITAEVSLVVAESRAQTGICVVFVRHTSASLVIQENADPSVQHDLNRWMNDIAPESRHWEHDAEGIDDMPAHARTSITRTNEVIPIVDGRLGLGTWQGIYLWEHRHSDHERQVIVHVQGE